MTEGLWSMLTALATAVVTVWASGLIWTSVKDLLR